MKKKTGIKGIWTLLLICLTWACLLSGASAKETAPSLSKKQLTLEAGTRKKLTIKNAKKVKWSVNKSKVVRLETIGKNGSGGVMVYGEKAGNAVITARTDGRILKCAVKVEKSAFQKRSPGMLYGITYTFEVNQDPPDPAQPVKAGEETTLYWDKVRGADGYYVYYTDSAKGTKKLVKRIRGAKNTTCVLEGERLGGYSVRAYQVTKTGTKLYSKYNTEFCIAE
ncbi:MAG: hypothetical protein Q4F41_16520 [Eubacteriales bacterium]|nr:hypothetical protein [Eubacteriales bacterium]